MHGEACHLLLIQVIAKGDFLEGSAGLLKPTLKPFAVFLRDLQDRVKLRQGIVHALYPLGHKRHTENGAVLRQQGVIAVVYQPPGRRHGLDLDAILV